MGETVPMATGFLSHILHLVLLPPPPAMGKRKASKAVKKLAGESIESQRRRLADSRKR